MEYIEKHNRKKVIGLFLTFTMILSLICNISISTLASATETTDETVASIQLPSGWSAPVKIYYYTSNSNNGWPGTEMTDMGNGKYSFTLPDDIDSANVIFNCNSGKTQIPASGQAGFLINKGENKIYTNGTWEDDEEIDETLALKEFSTSLASPQEIGATINLTASAAGGSGELSYEFSISKDDGKTFDVVQDYSNIKTYNWTPTEVGTYVLKVQVKDQNNNIDNKTIDYIINKNVITPKIKSITPKNDSTIIQNQETSITIDASGTEILFYKVQIIGPDGEYVDLGHYTTSNIYKFTPTETGKYTINVSVQLNDEDNTTTTQTIYYNVKSDTPGEKYSVNITTNIPEGGEILGGNGEYEPGEIVTIEPYVNSGYDFVGFTGSPQEVIDSISNCQFVMPEEDVIIVANFEKKTTQNTYKLTVETNGEYYGTTTGTGEYKPGDLVTIKAIPKDGAMFRGWTRISGSIELDDNTLSTVSFIMPEYDVTFRAQFIAISDIKIIAKSSDESMGEVSGDIDTTVKTGTEVTLVAEPKTGYKFVGWYNAGGGTKPLSTDSTWTFKAFYYTNVVAKFEAEL